jgi:DNA-binding CsgD family transcriptional regulator
VPGLTFSPRPGPASRRPPHPSRASVRSKVLELLAQGRSVMLVGHIGDGLIWVSEQLANDLGSSELLFNAASSPSLDAAEEFMDYTAKSRGAVIYGPGKLPGSGTDLLNRAIFHEDRPLVFAVGALQIDRDDAPHNPVLQFLMEQWSRDELARVDLSGVDEAELETMISQAAPDGVLNDLQVGALAASCSGLPMIALDLVHQDQQALRDVPLRAPAPSDLGMVLPRHVVQRMSRWYTGLDRDLSEILYHLWRISPVPESTAYRLYGEQPVRALMGRRLAEVINYEGTAHLRVPFLHGACARQVLDFDIEAVEHRFRRRLLGLHHSGFPMGDGPVMAASRYRLLGQDTYDVDDDDLLLTTAKLYVERGSATEAHAIAADLSSNASTPRVRFAAGAQLVQAHNLGGDHEQAQKLGLELMQGLEHQEFEPSTRTLMTLLGATSSAQQWLATTTPWWQDSALSARVEAALPGASFVFSSLVRPDLRAAQGQELCALMLQVDASPAIRLMAAMLAAANAVTSTDASGVVDALNVIESLASPTRTPQAPSVRRVHDDWWSVLARATALEVSLITGIPASHTVPENEAVAGFLQESMGTTMAPSWVRTYSAALLTGTLRLVMGQPAHASADAEAALVALRAGGPATALEAQTWLSTCLADVTRRPSGLEPAEHTTPGTAPDASVGDVIRRITAAHMRVVLGHSDPGTELTGLEPLLTRTDLHGFPLLKARIDHLVALRDDDPEHLELVGEALSRMHAVFPAQKAMLRARALFQARNASSKVARIDRWLADASAQHSQAEESRATRDAVSLTERQAEVASFVVQGYTNAQIASRLYLSVRTIESNVMQLRIKLGAPRRRDIPKKLQEHRLDIGS